MYSQVDSPFTPLGPTRFARMETLAGGGSDRVMMILVFAVAGIVAIMLAFRPAGHLVRTSGASKTSSAQSGSETAMSDQARSSARSLPARSGLSVVFTREVHHWEPQILAWAATYGLDPNIVATLMQVESCGDPAAVSSAGALGLFQVMPFHFSEDENALDPETNARRGLTYYAERIKQTGGDVGRAFAGYNGGHVAAAASWDSWFDETRRYYVWTTGIFGEASNGSVESSTLQQWLAAGGASLCRQAATRIGLM